MSNAFLFPGQGSQSVGMGEEYFSRFPELVDQANQELGYSLDELCLRGPEDKLAQTEFTQPALYLTSYLAARSLIDDGTKPDMAAGHSVGEFAALAIAKAFSFLDGLKIVAQRGSIMSRVSGGGMAAVIGMEESTLRDVLLAKELNQIDLANFNSPGQIVISGEAEQIQLAVPIIKESGAKLVVPLKVSGAFHSRMMEDPAKEFESFLSDFSISTPQFPVYSNRQALPYPDAGSVKILLVEQMRNSVLWSSSITRMRQDGAEEFFECGPGKVLTKLLRQIP